ncbi:MAG: cob(I)yrinic acid a,c-diamide adenosyltransferase [Sphaerochaetaceae bacterium]|nr:cob(I)yrinic acid a,c-diamide adenosyltransferase [Sphaerochaetaceae bacterium]MDX9938959.1 cob(I)yrinic acid a,c-diamide adenosyltransferase [Sphaerochaetaceae bacterium]
MQNHSSERVARVKRPLTILYTGNGKGKTTAALGLLFRALGHDATCAVMQFIKSERLQTGERKMAERLGVKWENHGTGFLWDETDLQEAREACVNGWEQAKQWILSGTYDMIVLDEFTYVLAKGFVPMEDFLAFLVRLEAEKGRPHVVITGRDAPQRLIDRCDMVHELVEIKHPWRTSSVPAQIMIEY